MEDTVSVAIRRCPFLAKVAAQNGTDYARGVALAPTETFHQHKLQPAGVDAEQQYEASFQLFHGAQGIVPLVVKPATSDVAPAASGCPFHAAHQRSAASPGLQPSSSKPPQAQPRTLPLATISLSFGSGPNFGDLLRKQLQKHQGSGSKRPPSNRAQQPQQPQHFNNSSSSASQGPGGACSASSSSNTGSTGPGGFKPQRPLTDPCAGSSGGAPRASGMGPGHGPHPSAAAAAGPSAAGAAAPQLGPGTQLGSSSSVHGAAGGAGAGAATSRGGWSALGSGSSSGLSAFSGSTASTAPSPFRASASSTASNTSSSSNSGVRGPGSGHGQRGLAGSSSSGGSGGGPSGGPPKKPSSKAGAAPAGRVNLPASTGGSTGRIVGSAGSTGAAATPACPLRKWLGPAAGLVFNEYDKLICPPPIVAARAALSRTAAVQSLRPQQLPVKLVAVAAVAAATNLPCGAVREHFEKFSVGWFVAIHATIPFVAMLRKAVIMPKYAMLVTFAAAVMGQVIGSRLERARLAQLQQQGLQDPLTAWMAPKDSASAAGAAAAPAPVLGSAAAGAAEVAGAGSSSGQRGAGWRAKLLAGARAGFAGERDGAAAASASASCGSEVGSRAIVGLGSWLPQLPVVKA